MKRTCKYCGSRGRSDRDVCRPCDRKPYRRHKKDHCEICGFVPTWIGQLDVDHIDGDHSNNDPENLQTLCANCHRLKTHMNAEYT